MIHHGEHGEHGERRGWARGAMPRRGNTDVALQALTQATHYPSFMVPLDRRRLSAMR